MHHRLIIMTALVAIALTSEALQPEIMLKLRDPEAEPDHEPEHELEGRPNESLQNGSAQRDPREDILPTPEKPEIVRASNSSVMVRWEIEDSPEILFYKIQYKKVIKKKNDKNPSRGDSGNTQQNNWKTEPRDIPAIQKAYHIGLTEKLSSGNYLFRVTAVFENHDTRESPEANFKLLSDRAMQKQNKPEIHAEPPVIESAKAYETSVLLVWRYDDTEPAIDGYFVYYRSEHSASDFIIIPTADDRMDVIKLQPDTPYEFKVQAFNPTGVSEISQPMSARTKIKAPVSSTTESPPVPTTVPSTQVSPDTSHNDVQPSNDILTSKPDQKPNAEVPVDVLKQMYEFFNRVWSGENKSYLIMLVLVAVVFSIVSTIGCIFCCVRREEDPIKNHQFDQIGINAPHNGFFMNSFAEVELRGTVEVKSKVQMNGTQSVRPQTGEFQFDDFVDV